MNNGNGSTFTVAYANFLQSGNNIFSIKYDIYHLGQLSQQPTEENTEVETISLIDTLTGFFLSQEPSDQQHSQPPPRAIEKWTVAAMQTFSQTRTPKRMLTGQCGRDDNLHFSPLSQQYSTPSSPLLILNK